MVQLLPLFARTYYSAKHNRKFKELTNMSQQHMEFDESQRERPGASYTGHEASRGATAAQRLALAIVSFVLWIALFLIIAAIMSSYIPPFGPDGYAQSISNILFPFLIIGFLIFSAIVILVNVLFNRKR